jgi:hypothetical protein
VTAFEVVIRLGRAFSVRLDGRDRFVTADEFVTVPFANREAAEAALRDVQMSVRQVHDAGGEDYRPVVAGLVLATGAGVDSAGGCLCPGRAEGKHGMLCEHVLRGAFGQVGDAPEDVRRMLRELGRMVAGELAADVEPVDDAR